MSQLIPFNFGGLPVRVVMTGDEPWFVVNDLCAVLKIGDPRSAVQRIDDRDVGQTHVTDSLGRDQKTNIVNESGLYELVFRSDKPEARVFRRWVTHEVLPEIRRTGSYSAKPLSDLDLIRASIDAIEADRARINVLEAKVSAIEGRHDWFTTLAYAKLNDLPTDTVSTAKHGKRATRLMKSRGQEPLKRVDEKWGFIGVYPLDVLDETADQ